MSHKRVLFLYCPPDALDLVWNLKIKLSDLRYFNDPFEFYPKGEDSSIQSLKDSSDLDASLAEQRLLMLEPWLEHWRFICFSKKNLCPLMSALYAAKGTGFILGINVNDPNFFGGIYPSGISVDCESIKRPPFPEQYFSQKWAKLPVPSIYENENFEVIIKKIDEDLKPLIFTKAPHWKDEEEVRFKYCLARNENLLSKGESDDYYLPLELSCIESISICTQACYFCTVAPLLVAVEEKLSITCELQRLHAEDYRIVSRKQDLPNHSLHEDIAIFHRTGVFRRKGRSKEHCRQMQLKNKVVTSLFDKDYRCHQCNRITNKKNLEVANNIFSSNPQLFRKYLGFKD